MSVYAKLLAAKKNLEVLEEKKVHFAVQGCSHGDLDQIYDACRQHEKDFNKKISFLICCGDFQAIRDNGGIDMSAMAVPDRYKEMGDFYKYHGENPEKVAPYLTIFIGGNHEASNLLMENYYGGFVAKNIYYLGHSGVINVCGLRIAGLSGIYKGRDYIQPYPQPPYSANDPNAIRSAYHVRAMEIAKLALVNKPVDIFLTHDWPVGITKYGDEEALLQIKPDFRDDINHNALGNPNTLALTKKLQPTYHFAAHLHCFFEAKVPHMCLGEDGKLDSSKVTTFHALDKCTRRRGQLSHFIDYYALTPQPGKAASKPSNFSEEDGSVPDVQLDEEWIDIVTFSHRYLYLGVPRRGNHYDEHHPVIKKAQEPPRAKDEWLSGEKAPMLPNNGVAPVSTRELLRKLHLPYHLPEDKNASALGDCGGDGDHVAVPTSSAPPAPVVKATDLMAADDDDDDMLFVEDVVGGE